MNIIDACRDHAVFGQHFRGETWTAWFVFLAALFALPMSAEQLELYRKHTGRSTTPTEPLHEAWLICGRRAGNETAETNRLRNRVTVETHTASFRSARGYTIITALLDEVAIWPTDETSSEPDIEVINAIKYPRGNAPVCQLTACAERRAVERAPQALRQGHDPVLVWKGTTRDMNATVPQAFIDAHLAEDAARAGAEYLAQFRTDLESYVDIAVVEGCVGDHREMLPTAGTAYSAFVDPASGSGEDSFTCAVGHKVKDGT